MNDTAQIITAIATLIASLGGVVLGILNSRKIQQVHESTNGKMEELLRVTSESAHAKGVKDEKDNPGAK